MIQESSMCLAFPTCLTSATGQHNRPRASISSATGQNNFGHGPLLTAMIGNQSIAMSLPINEIQVTTEKDLDNQIKEAIGGDKEAGHIVQVRIDYSVKQPIVLVLKCLGVSEAVDCGTFGAPRSIDPLVYVLKNTLENALVSFASGKSYFNPPYNEKELSLQCLRDWIWNTVVQAHHL